MSMDAARQHESHSPGEQLEFAREVLRMEGEAVLALRERVGAEFLQAVNLLLACEGSVIVTGMGKAGLVGQKIAATLASTGTTSHFLHPAEAVHGDLSRIHARDVVLMMSFSGSTEEVVRLLPAIEATQVPLIALTGKPNSPLGSHATVTLDLGPLTEACGLGLAPSTSTTAMLALGDALALLVSRMRDFQPEDFARFHPGGSLGRKLAKVEEAMRPLRECRLATARKTVRQALIEVGRPGRRSGAIMMLDDDGVLQGIFTDSDLARLLEARREQDLDQPMERVMTRQPIMVSVGARLQSAVDLMAEHKLSELPVVDGSGKAVGLLDITDVVDVSAPRAGSSTASPSGPAGRGPADDVTSTGTEATGTEADAPATVPFPNRHNPHKRNPSP